MKGRLAFTLIEVLISILLLGLILPALYSSVDLLQDSNTHLFNYVQKTKKEIRITQTLYLDIASSDGNLSIHKGEFDRLCMAQTQNSLYGLSSPKVCWLVLKERNVLARVEGVTYHLPLQERENVEVAPVLSNVELFDLYWQKDKVVVLLKQKGEKATTFMVQGITRPKPKKKKNRQGKKQQNSVRVAPPSSVPSAAK